MRRLLFLWGCHQLIELGSAKHHPQKRHIPRQAGQAQAYCLLSNLKLACKNYIAKQIKGYFTTTNFVRSCVAPLSNTTI